MLESELRTKFNEQYGAKHAWPETYEVDADTYGHVCNAILKDAFTLGFHNLEIWVGNNGGILWKNIELILVNKNE